MGEESNLEKRLIFLGVVSTPPFQDNIENPEPIGTVKNIFNTEAEMEITIELKDSRTFRKILGLPEVPLSKVKRRRKTVKKALMAYGKSRNTAEAVCKCIAWSNGRIAYSDMGKNLIDTLGR